MELEPEIASCGHYIEHDNECHEVGIKEERERLLQDLTKLVDRLNTSRPTSHWIRDLYRFIEASK
jgi:Tfp pilus assembly protein PilN